MTGPGGRAGAVRRIAAALVASASAAAAPPLAVWTFGLVGRGRDPLSGVLVVPLGAPWGLPIGAAPEAWPP